MRFISGSTILCVPLATVTHGGVSELDQRNGGCTVVGCWWGVVDSIPLWVGFSPPAGSAMREGLLPYLPEVSLVAKV